jgi:hypothetical protein
LQFIKSSIHHLSEIAIHALCVLAGCAIDMATHPRYPGQGASPNQSGNTVVAPLAQRLLLVAAAHEATRRQTRSPLG